MVSGGTRFTRPGRSGAAPRAIDVEVRPPHKTLYEVLVVPPTTSSRQIRKIARALRRNLPNLSDLDDVGLAEEVLGRRDLRAEYDALLARARAAKLMLPQIGAAFEGSRPPRSPSPAPTPIPPSIPPPAPAPFSSVGRAGASSSGDATKLLLRVAVAAISIGIWVARGSRHSTDHDRTPELPPIRLPRFEPPKIDIPRVDLHELGLDKIGPARLEPDKHGPPKFEIDKRELDRALAPKHKPPRPTPAKPRKADPVPIETPAETPVETPIETRNDTP